MFQCASYTALKDYYGLQNEGLVLECCQNLLYSLMHFLTMCQDCVSDLIHMNQPMRDQGRKFVLQCPESSQGGGTDLTLGTSVPSVTQIIIAVPLEVQAEIFHFLNLSEFPMEPTRHHSDATGTCMVLPLLPKPQLFVHILLFHLPYVLLPVEWEVQNHIPSGTILKALISGGVNGPWMKFMRAEITTEDFLQEFGRLCSEIVSDKHT